MGIQKIMEYKRLGKPKDKENVINKSYWKENMTFGGWGFVMLLILLLKIFCRINLEASYWAYGL